jgi:hypothetical protein
MFLSSVGVEDKLVLRQKLFLLANVVDVEGLASILGCRVASLPKTEREALWRLVGDNKYDSLRGGLHSKEVGGPYGVRAEMLKEGVGRFF